MSAYDITKAQNLIQYKLNVVIPQCEAKAAEFAKQAATSRDDFFRAYYTDCMEREQDRANKNRKDAAELAVRIAAELTAAIA